MPQPAFVCFHADRPSGADGAHPNANLAAREYHRMIDLLFRSIRLTNPGAECVLLTDADALYPGISGPVRTVKVPVAHDALMLSRTAAQAAFVAAHDFARPVVLLDSDILLNASLAPVFAADFDVGVTWRRTKEMPINGGLILLNGRRPAAAKAFFARLFALYRERFAGDANAAWYGDQLALQECVGLAPGAFGAADVVERDGCRIRLLPCETHNFSPDNRLDAIVDGLRDKAVIHFKGQRKRLMQPFWDAFLAPQTPRWWFPRLRRQRAGARLRALADAEAKTS